ncbi:fungal specific transcription factor domain-containing protein [Colletotrichum sojae]|uniref:Fungal specific transcription factor domain-containing protein n=1 Tax=Colletotrichum sojae TaxID=2175907 RepID=A0A8H6INP2_9PEZI|nr:fungal specific transcription factor domain-containing protein [Colletotrichum sojae]
MASQRRNSRCDLRRPGCLKCEKLKRPCPGYRNLTEVIFRDEVPRIKKKARNNSHFQEVVGAATGASLPAILREPPGSQCPGTSWQITPALSPSLEDRAASFFFANYTTTGPPFCDTYQSWVTQEYLKDGPDSKVRVIVQAVGMAAISNVHNAPDVAVRAEERYCKALQVTNSALRDPSQVAADSTLMSILLLGLQFPSKSPGVTNPGPCTLKGPLLYYNFEDKPSSPESWDYSSMFSFETKFFRIVNLRADIKRRHITDPDTICQIALDINTTLQIWATMQTERAYFELDMPDDSCGLHFRGKSHVYTSTWGAQVWNNWRSLGILANQIILDHVDQQLLLDEATKDAMRSTAVAFVQNLSMEICISTSALSSTPRKSLHPPSTVPVPASLTDLHTGAPTMVWPLYIVTQEVLNSTDVREWAADQLRSIRRCMGIKQAAFLAEDACPNWRESGTMPGFNFL